MKKLKIIIAAILMTGLTQVTKAQDSETSFGIRAGVNFQNINGKEFDGDKSDNKLIPGFNAGINVELPVAPDFYLQPGLLFTTKGAKNEFTLLGSDYKTTLNLSYVELPINFLYKPLLGAGKLIVGFGPYVAMAVAGKETEEGPGIDRSTTVKFENKVKLSDPDDAVYVRPLDAGANIMFGYEMSNKLSVQLNTQLGLMEINPEYEGFEEDKSSLKHTGFGLSLGYRF